ncbi:uncharacterized protein LOC124899624 [Capsicum annuum]|uniref:uncharacterized protein LOC124899624 n=1 Tax=Capsicum annuum TaxID=4072 RepID=UPI001FB08902|nr:uncharacterized protein LOC124899624 [Capsicum annuum]
MGGSKVNVISAYVLQGGLDEEEKKSFWEEKGWVQKLYKLAKDMERRDRDLEQMKCIKGEDGTVLVEDAFIRKRWQSYFHKLLNDDGGKGFVLEDLEKSEECRNYGYCRHIEVEEVKRVIRRMCHRAMGPDEIPVDFWNALVGQVWSG